MYIQSVPWTITFHKWMNWKQMLGSNETNLKLKPIGNGYGYISKQWLCLFDASQCLDQWFHPYECISNPFLVSHDHCSMNTIGACTIYALTNDFSQMESLKTIALSNETIPQLKYMLLACKVNALRNCIVWVDACAINPFLATEHHCLIVLNGVYTICALNNNLSQMDELKTNAWFKWNQS